MCWKLLNIKNCVLGIADQELRLENCQSRIACWKLLIKNCVLKIAIKNCMWEIADQILRVKNCRSQIPYWKLLHCHTCNKNYQWKIMLKIANSTELRIENCRRRIGYWKLLFENCFIKFSNRKSRKIAEGELHIENYCWSRIA